MARRILIQLVLLLALPLISGSAQGRSAADVARNSDPATTASYPAYCTAEHNVGKIVLSVTNGGTIGTGYDFNGGIDCFTGQPISSCEFPRGSGANYLFSGALWIGAVVGQDTLVSTGADGWSTLGNELQPEEPPVGDMFYRSTTDPTAPEFVGAVSEEDYVAVYTDTCVNCLGVTYDEIDGRPHRPIGLEIKQSSYAWSYPHAEDFVLFDYRIRNMGQNDLNEVYLGFYVDADVYPNSMDGSEGAQDDLSGFLNSASNPFYPGACTDSLSLQLGWAADNDGGLNGPWSEEPTPAVTGLLLLDTPSDSIHTSFNWWISNGNPSLDFGPQRRDGYRDLGTGGLGTPTGDRNKYFMLSNGEFDYDQVRTATIDSLDSIWLPPPVSHYEEWATGLDTRYLLSFGPFDILAGESLPLIFAYVAGDEFHTDPDNIDNLYENPDAYYEGVDFTDLVANAVWAGWTYDNPGFDTDGDGDFGKFTVCEGDTFWYEGDGVPDFRAAAPPAPPTLWVEPRVGGFRVRWNGSASELSVDPFSRAQDFEGYNVYVADGDIPQGFVRLAGFDVEDYYKYAWSSVLDDWDIARERFMVEDLICAYAPSGCNDLSWHPLDFPRENPFFLSGGGDSVFYFEPILANSSIFGLETPIEKLYPTAPKPSWLSPEEVPEDSADVYLTEDGFFKYYEYEYLIDGLLPGHTYRIAVTAFDYGSFAIHTLPQETAHAMTAVEATTLLDPGNCCEGSVGSVALVPDCESIDQEVDIIDIQTMIDHLFLSLRPLCCEAEGDVDRSGEVDIVDLQLLVDDLYLSLLPLPTCP